jgi:hypothetical protein
MVFEEKRNWAEVVPAEVFLHNLTTSRTGSFYDELVEKKCGDQPLQRMLNGSF